MTTAEFDRWYTDLTLRWPSVSTWLAKCFPDGAQQRALLRTWRDVLKDVAIADCLDVNLQMQSGDLGWVGEYDSDKERLPQHVRRLARELAYGHRERPEEPRGELKPSAFPAGKILRRMIELIDRGTPRKEAKRLVLDEFPVGKPRWEPRYNCLICLDVGMVTVASQTALDYLLADKFHECHHRESAVRCLCRPPVPHDPKRKPPCVYDAAQDFKIEDFTWGEAEVARFTAWVAIKRNEFWESKRESVFDHFNQREFAK